MPHGMHTRDEIQRREKERGKNKEIAGKMPKK
jgi:hypothetical protein